MQYNWKEKDWHELETKHTEAFNFLLQRSLVNEFKHLETNYIVLNEWEKKRHAELEAAIEFDGEILR